MCNRNKSLVLVLLLSLVMPVISYCQDPFSRITPKNVLQFKAKYGLIDWQPGIKGFNLDLSGIDPNSACGKELDLKRVVKSVIKRNPTTRRDSVCTDFNKSLFDTIKINSTQFTDLMIKYKAKTIIRSMPAIEEYDKEKTDYRGIPDILTNWSLHYTIVFDEEFDIDKIKSELESIKFIEGVSKPGIPTLY